MNSRKLTAAILMMSLVQMGTNGIAPILSQIQQAFPDAAPAEVQLLMSFPAAFVVVFSFVTSFLAAKIAYKYLAVSGLIFTAAAGFLAFLFHHDITELFVWAGIMGTGIGLAAPIAPTLINKHFDGYRKQRLLGFQNTFSTMGSMIMTFACGLLASRGWEYGYLVYLIAVPGIIFTSLGVRGDDRETVSGRGKNISGTEQWKGIPVWPEMLIAFFFLLSYSSTPTNLAMLFEERNIRGTVAAGTASTIFLFGGMLAGLFYGAVFQKLKRYVVPLGAACLLIGEIILATQTSLVLLLTGCFIGGASISFVMPACMAAASKMRGRESLGSTLILSSANCGVFAAPVITCAAEMIAKNSDVETRIMIAAAIDIAIIIMTCRSAIAAGRDGGGRDGKTT